MCGALGKQNCHPERSNCFAKQSSHGVEGPLPDQHSKGSIKPGAPGQAQSCKKRKDGAPPAGILHAKVVKGGHRLQLKQQSNNYRSDYSENKRYH